MHKTARNEIKTVEDDGLEVDRESYVPSKSFSAIGCGLTSPYSIWNWLHQRLWNRKEVWAELATANRSNCARAQADRVSELLSSAFLTNRRLLTTKSQFNALLLTANDDDKKFPHAGMSTLPISHKFWRIRNDETMMRKGLKISAACPFRCKTSSRRMLELYYLLYHFLFFRVSHTHRACGVIQFHSITEKMNKNYIFSICRLPCRVYAKWMYISASKTRREQKWNERIKNQSPSFCDISREQSTIACESEVIRISQFCAIISTAYALGLRLEWIESDTSFSASTEQREKTCRSRAQTKTRFLVTASLIPNPERNQQPWEYLRRGEKWNKNSCSWAPNDSIAARMSRETFSLKVMRRNWTWVKHKITTNRALLQQMWICDASKHEARKDS